MKIIGLGLSGLIGRSLIATLGKKHEVTHLKRGAFKEWKKEMDGAEAVINLSGENLAAKRWTTTQKETIRNSRILSTRALVEAIASSPHKPKTLINASAVGYYGAQDSSLVDEAAPAGSGFLAETCSAWEKEASRAGSYGVRTVLLRTGIVLTKEGGALAKMLPAFRFFIGGPLGSGKQFMSWIHIEDEVGAMIHCLNNGSLSGPVNLTAPDPVSMKIFAATLGKVTKRPSWAPVPAPALKLLLGEMSDMLLTGQRALPKKLLQAGFQFKFSTLQAALQDLL